MIPGVHADEEGEKPQIKQREPTLEKYVNNKAAWRFGLTDEGKEGGK